MGEIIQQAYEALNRPDEARLKRINKMVALYKYRFQWSRKTFIEKCLEWIPELKEKVSESVTKNWSTKGLYAAMELRDMNIILTKLELIENNNKRRKKSNGNSRFNNK